MALSPVEEELLKFLKAQAEADLNGSMRAIKESQDRLYDLFLRQEAEHKEEFRELRDDMRGLSLRVRETEKGVAQHEEALKHLRATAEKHEDDLEDSQRWHIEDLEKKKGKAEESVTFFRRNIFGIIAGIVATASTLWHFFR